MVHERIRKLADTYGIGIIYLFGSQAEEGARYLETSYAIPDNLSDLDIAVYFIKNPKQDLSERYGEIYMELSYIFDVFNIDLVFMNDMETLFQYEIITGIRVFEHDAEYADVMEEIIMKKSADLSLKQRIMNKDIMEAVEDGYFDLEYRASA